MPIRGSCLCGDVTFTIETAGAILYHCHCSMCRKAHGAAFATYVAAPRGSVALHGDGSVKHYASRPGSERAFCGRCGSVVPPGTRASGVEIVPVGLLDEDPGLRPLLHIFVGAKAPWHTITDQLPRHEAYPPGWGEALAVARPTEHAAGEVRGSCLCGGIAYAVDGALEGPIVCCHCTRCQKARAGAHASNTFVALPRFRWLRGEELVASYKVPEAKTFTHSFCSVCGGGVPRVSVERSRVVIPSPGLDDDPGARPELHIFVESKAPWHEISDDLPQYATYPPGDFPPPPRR